MISSKIMAVAETVIKDAETNNVSIINILENISAESFPIALQRISVVCFFDKELTDPDLVNLKFEIINNENKLIEHQIKVDFRGKTTNRTILKFGGVVFPFSGLAIFKVSDSDDRVICEYSLNLKLREAVQVSSP